MAQNDIITVDTPSPDSMTIELRDNQSSDGSNVETPDNLMSDIDMPSVDISEEERVRLERQEWIRQLRLQFCVRKDFEQTCQLIHEDGSLNQAYFRPDPSMFQNSGGERRWTDKERTLLIQGIERFGIGHFREISEALLPDWSGNDLRVKCIRLIGRQNLQLYRDWRGDAAAITREYERNKEIGLALNAWKSGALVYDDAGHVLERIQATEPSAVQT